MAQEIARFPQVCVRADRRSAIMQHGNTVRGAMKFEWRNGRAPMQQEAVEGAGRFVGGLGRPDCFGSIRRLRHVLAATIVLSVSLPIRLSPTPTICSVHPFS